MTQEVLAQMQEPLTVEMIWELAEQYGAQIGDTFDYVGYTKAIEAKLKEKT